MSLDDLQEWKFQPVLPRGSGVHEVRRSFQAVNNQLKTLQELFLAVVTQLGVAAYVTPDGDIVVRVVNDDATTVLNDDGTIVTVGGGLVWH